MKWILNFFYVDKKGGADGVKAGLSKSSGQTHSQFIHHSYEVCRDHHGIVDAKCCCIQPEELMTTTTVGHCEMLQLTSPLLFVLYASLQTQNGNTDQPACTTYPQVCKVLLYSASANDRYWGSLWSVATNIITTVCSLYFTTNTEWQMQARIFCWWPMILWVTPVKCCN